MLSAKDKNIISKIEKRINEDHTFWDFKDNYQKEHIHGIFTYPATMVPKMQAELMNIIMDEDKETSNILDPFMGSGTIPVEGMIRSLDVFGIDINPLAILIAKVKTTPLPIDSLNIKTSYLLNQIDTLVDFQPADFPGIQKWFNTDIIWELSKIREAIRREPDVEFRRFFWVSFCEIIRLSSNSQKTTFKLHIKKKDDIQAFKYECISNFKKHILQNIDRMEEFLYLLGKRVKYYDGHYKYKNNIRLVLGDSLKTINDRRRFSDNSIDLISTSPPYGDNHTTVTYGQYSVLQLRWIDIDDIDKKVDPNILNTQTKIDNKSLGGSLYSCQFISDSGILDKSQALTTVYNKLISDSEIEKARKVAGFYIDFLEVLKSIVRVLKPEKYAIFTVGNRRVNNEIVEFNKILIELCEPLNMILVYDFRRNILNKRMAEKISKLKTNEPVNSMKEENVLIFKKRSEHIISD